MQAIVLSRRDVRENDQIVSFYTYSEGKRHFLARGVKKLTSKNAAHLEPFSIVELDYVPGRELDHLTKVQPVEYFSSLRGQLATSLAAMSAVCITDQLTQEKEPDNVLFNALKSWLQFIARNERVSVTLLDAYVLSLIGRLGFTPILDKCVVCGLSFREICQSVLTDTSGIRSPGIYFAGGGVICHDCRVKKVALKEEILPAGLSELNAMALLQKSDWRLVAEYPLTAETATRLHKLVYLYLLYHTEREVADFGRALADFIEFR